MSLITIKDKKSYATISTFGAWLKEYSVNGKNVLYPGIEFIKDGVIKRRGGIPVLFPNAGNKIVSEKFNLAQHGFARDHMWKIIDKTDNSVSLELCTNDIIFKQYLYKFSTRITFEVKDNSLSINLTVSNLDNVVMPVAPGFHPYFNLPKGIRSKFINPIDNLKFDGSTEYVKSEGDIVFELPEVGKIDMGFSKNLKNLSYWAEENSDFICIEPWVEAEGAMLDEKLRINIKPQDHVAFDLRITLA